MSTKIEPDDFNWVSEEKRLWSHYTDDMTCFYKAGNTSFQKESVHLWGNPHLIICYPDFQWAVMTNEHFVMTRKHTIAEGDPYCDKVFHDTRINKKPKHPSKELIDSMDSKIEKKEDIKQKLVTH